MQSNLAYIDAKGAFRKFLGSVTKNVYLKIIQRGTLSVGRGSNPLGQGVEKLYKKSNTKFLPFSLVGTMKLKNRNERYDFVNLSNGAFQFKNMTKARLGLAVVCFEIYRCILGSFEIQTRRGTRNAHVFPDPVSATPITSLFCRPIGMACL